MARFELGLALTPHGAISNESGAERTLSALDEIERSGLTQALCALNDLDALPAELGLDPACARAVARVTESLRVTLMRRLTGVDVRLSEATRSALWERLWLDAELDLTLARDLSISSAWDRCADMSAAIARVGVAFRDDPRWSQANVRAQRDDLSAERVLAWLINHDEAFAGLSAELAPLDADVIHHLDLSVKRARPRARGWIQLSLSAELELNTHKVRQLKRSAACALVSPRSLLTHVKRAYSDEQQKQWWRTLGVDQLPRDETARARIIALELKSLLSVRGVSGYRAQQRVSSLTHHALCPLIAHQLNSALGRRAARSYRHRDRLPEYDHQSFDALVSSASL